MKLFYLIFFGIIFSFCAPKVYKQLNWQKKTVTTDGNLSEWVNPLRYFDADSKLNYTISNDRQNLYICIKAGDDATQIKILRGGMEIGIDTSAKKDFPITISFPIPHSGGRMHKKEQREKEEGEENNVQSDLSKKQHLAEDFKEMQVTGFLIPATSITPLNNGYGISAALDVDKNDVLAYELIIPFKTFYKNELAPADSNKVMNYQIKVNGIAVKDNGGSGNSGGGGQSGGGGGGGMGGGGMGGSGGMGGGGGMRGGGMRGSGSGGAAVNPLSVMDKVLITAKFSYK